MLEVILGIVGLAASVGVTMWILYLVHRDNPHLWTPTDHDDPDDQEKDQ